VLLRGHDDAVLRARADQLVLTNYAFICQLAKPPHFKLFLQHGVRRVEALFPVVASLVRFHDDTVVITYVNDISEFVDA
jgi:hypothetical protein